MIAEPINWPKPSKAAILRAVFEGTPDGYGDAIGFVDAAGVEWALKEWSTTTPGGAVTFRATRASTHPDFAILEKQFTTNDVTDDWVFVTRRALRIGDLMR